MRVKRAAMGSQARCRENGQATVEYAILTALAAVALVVTFMNAQQVITNYYYDIAAIVCLPVP